MSSSENSQVEEPEVEVVFQKEIDSSIEVPMSEWSSLELVDSKSNIKRFRYSEGLYDPGSGEICAKYIPISASSVLRHPYFHYPSILDPGIEEALLRPPPKITFPDDGQELYIFICREMNQCPVTSFYRQLLELKINLRYYCVNPVGVRAMAMALKLNKMVKILDLTENFLSEDACYHLGEMLIENVTLESLILCGCKIGAQGAKRLLYNLSVNHSLRQLDLSRNQIDDEGVEYLADAIVKGSDVVNLNLSYNNLTGKSAVTLAEAFLVKNKLTHLDMSWNNMYGSGSISTLCSRLSENPSFLSLNLSWNSMSGKRVGTAIRNLLINRNISHLDLSNNSLEGAAIKEIGFNLFKAKKLKTLNLSYNPMSPLDALGILLRLRDRRVNLQYLLLDNVFVSDDFMEERDAILKLNFRKNTVITWGGIRAHFVSKGVDARNLLLNRCEAICKKSKKNPIDIALVILEMYKESKEPLLPGDFSRTVRSRGAQLDDDLIDEMCNVFAGRRTPKSKTISIDMLVDFIHRKWPDRKLPPTPPPEPEPEPEPKKGKKQKKK